MEQLVRELWDELRRGDLTRLEGVFAPDARWRAVEDGPWNCESRREILDVMRRNLDRGLAGEVDHVLELGDRAIVAFRPARHDPGGWPLDDGLRYIVLTAHDGLISEMKGCATRADALAYANTEPGSSPA